MDFTIFEAHLSCYAERFLIPVYNVERFAPGVVQKNP